jgi:hypothetical protein
MTRKRLRRVRIRSRVLRKKFMTRRRKMKRIQVINRKIT